MSDTEKTLHEAAAGAKCHAGPDGFCLTCGVEMTVCNVCNGIGYHREDCSAFATEVAAVADMDPPITISAEGMWAYCLSVIGYGLMHAEVARLRGIRSADA